MLLFEVIDGSITEEYGGAVGTFEANKVPPRKPISKPTSTTQLTFRIRLALDQHVTISGGDQLKEISGSLSVHPQTCEPDENAMGIGVLSYMSAEPGDEFSRSSPASFWIQVAIPQAQFIALLGAARAGVVPSDVTVTERGMSLSDEFSKHWDTNGSPHLHVAAISFSLPIAADDENLTDEKLPRPRFLRPTHSQLLRVSEDARILRESMQALLVMTRSLLTTTRWLIVLVVVIGF